MIKLEVKGQVLQALEVAFPSSNCVKGLKTYTQQLALLILLDLCHGSSIWTIQKKVYRISLKKLRDNGGRLGKKHIHEWLRDNNYGLVEKLEEGNPFDGTLSLIKLTDLVDLSIDIDLSSTNQEETFELYFPKYSKLSQGEQTAKYDLLPVDLNSLHGYIDSLPKNVNVLSAKNYSKLIKAVLVYNCAKHNNGYFPQKKLDPPSFFGRNYYSGLSIQNIKKDLRPHILGDCWEYDINSCVVTWKLGHAQEYLYSKYDHTAVEDSFLCSYAYVDQKKELIDEIKSDVFVDSELDDIEQTSTIKEALTALNFGARLTEYGYFNEFGKSQTPAIAKIFKDRTELKRFNKCIFVTQFQKEQKILDTFILNEAIKNQPEIFTYSELLTESGRRNNKKVMSYLFQHAETHVMDVVRSVALQNNLTILANIHDAIILKEDISAELLQQIETAMRISTDNPYWKLGKKQLVP